MSRRVENVGDAVRWLVADGFTREEAERIIYDGPEPLTAGHGREKTLSPCGTPAAYRRHLRRGEPIDAACRTANAIYQAAYKAGRTAAPMA